MEEVNQTQLHESDKSSNDVESSCNEIKIERLSAVSVEDLVSCNQQFENIQHNDNENFNIEVINHDCKMSNEVISMNEYSRPTVIRSGAVSSGFENLNCIQNSQNNVSDHTTAVSSNRSKNNNVNSQDICGGQVKKISKRSAKDAKTSALSSLLAYGGSSSEDDNDDQEEGEGATASDCNLRSADICEGLDADSSNANDHEDIYGSTVFGDMSLKFPRTQQLIDDDALSLSSSSSSSTSSSTSLVFSLNSDASDDDYDDEFEVANKSKINDDAAKKNKTKPQNKKKNKQLVTNGELTLDDLPAIKDLHISVPQDQCVLLGKILNIVDKLVVVQALKDLPALDLDTVLFLQWDKPLGQVFDVFGPVIEPLYCIRFNSNEHIQMKDISVGLPVYFVPKSNHTKFVFLAQLINIKGSDASWEDNNEPPLEFLEFSDDEQERQAKKQLRKTRFKKERRDPDEPQKKRPTAYERRMNRRNLKMTEIRGGQIQNKKPWMQQNQLIRPPTLIPPPGCNNLTNAPPADISLRNSTCSDFKTSFLQSPQQHVTSHRIQDCFPSLNREQGVQIHSPGLPVAGDQLSFQSSCNLNRPPPSPWAVTPMTSNTNVFSAGNVAIPPSSLLHPSNVYSSSPHPLPGGGQFHFSPALQSPPPHVFSSPPPNFSNNNNNNNNLNFSSAFHTPPRPGPSHNHVQSSLSSFPFFCNNNEASARNFPLISPPPPNSSTSMFSIPPPIVPFSSNSEVNFAQPFSSSPSGDRTSQPYPASADNNLSNNLHSSFPAIGNRLPWFPRQNNQRFQNNYQRPSNPTPPNSRF